MSDIKLISAINNLEILNNLQLNTENWFLTERSKVKNISYSNNKITISFKGSENNQVVSLIAGGGNIDICPDDSAAYNIVEFDSINFSVNIEHGENMSVNLLVVQFSHQKECYRDKIKLNNSNNIIKFNKHKRATCMNVAFQIEISSVNDELLVIHELSLFNLAKFSYFLIYKNFSNGLLFKPRSDVDAIKLKIPLDWSIDPFNDKNWCFQLHAWRMIGHLLMKFDKSLVLDDLELCFTIIEDWYRFTIQEGKLTTLTWDEMAGGLRALNIAYLIDRLFALGFDRIISDKHKKTLMDLAHLHIRKLMEQDFIENNHGIFQMHGLVMLSLLFNDDKGIRYGLNKIEYLIKQQFYPDGFHTENSVKYHLLVLKIFEKILPFHLYKNHAQINTLLEKATACKKWTIFPDQNSLMIGDSNYTSYDIKLTKEVDTDTIYKLFPDSGYLFVRSGFKIKQDEAFMLFLQTSFKNITHRQSDDFNVLLYEYGINILVDAGNYSYDRCPERTYVMSSRAHNTVVIDGTDYNRTNLFYESALKCHQEINGTFLMKTHLERTDLKVTHSRWVIYRPKKFCVVIDFLVSKKKRKYDQFWHFHQGLELSATKEGFVANINDKISMDIIPSVIDLKLYGDKHAKDSSPNTKLIKGQKHPELQGWRMKEYKELIENYALQNTVKAKQAILITKFIFNNSNEKLVDVNVDIDVASDFIIYNVVSEYLDVELEIKEPKVSKENVSPDVKSEIKKPKVSKENISPDVKLEIKEPKVSKENIGSGVKLESKELKMKKYNTRPAGQEPFCCSICGLVNDNKPEKGICAECQSRPRIRTLPLIFSEVIPNQVDAELAKSLPILAFAPIKIERKMLSTYFKEIQSVSLFGTYGKGTITNVDARDLSRFKDNTFSSIYSMSVYEYFLEQEQALREAYRVISPGGVFMNLFLPTRVKSGDDGPTVVWEFYPNEKELPYAPRDKKMIGVSVGKDWYVNLMEKIGFKSEIIEIYDEISDVTNTWFIGKKL